MKEHSFADMLPSKTRSPFMHRYSRYSRQYSPLPKTSSIQFIFQTSSSDQKQAADMQNINVVCTDRCEEILLGLGFSDSKLCSSSQLCTCWGVQEWGSAMAALVWEGTQVPWCCV